MKDKRLNNLRRFCDGAFDIELEKLIKADDKRLKGVEVLVYSPTLKAPFWKMVTAGVSEIGHKNPFTKYCGTELVAFVERNVRFYANDEWKYFYNLLLDTATFHIASKKEMKVGGVAEFPEREGDMKGTVLLAPEGVAELLGECALDGRKSCKFLQVMPVTERELITAKSDFNLLRSAFYGSNDKYSLDFVAKEHRIE